MRMSEEETLENCQKVLRKIRLAMTKQRNINRDVQNGVSELEELLDIIKDYRRNWKSAEKERGLCQQILENTNNAQKIEKKDKPIAASAKRNASSPAEINPGKKPKESTTENERKRPIDKQPESEKESSKRKDILNGEKMVSARRKRARQPKKRSDAVIIRPNEGRSFAEVLKNLKGNVRPDESEVKIRGIRKTMGGSILLQIEKGGDQDKFRKSIKDKLKGEAEVKDLRPKATLEIRDLDALSTDKEVIAAIKSATQIAEDELSVRLTATNRQEQRRAFVVLPFNAAKELLRTSRIKVGWANCRIRYRKESKRCYRCFGIGHLQFECTGIDRKSMELCIRCGEKGHKLRECKNPPKCCFGVPDGRTPADHLP